MFANFFCLFWFFCVCKNNFLFIFFVMSRNVSTCSKIEIHFPKKWRLDFLWPEHVSARRLWSAESAERLLGKSMKTFQRIPPVKSDETFFISARDLIVNENPTANHLSTKITRKSVQPKICKVAKKCCQF